MQQSVTTTARQFRGPKPVSARYQPIDSRRLVDTLLDACNESNIGQVQLRKYGDTEGGIRPHYYSLRFPERSIWIGRTERLTPEAHIWNSGDGTQAACVHIGCFRNVCQNGLSWGDSLYSERIIHVQGPTIERKLAEFRELAAGAVEYIGSGALRTEVWQLQEEKLTLPEMAEVVCRTPGLSRRVRERTLSRLLHPDRVEDGSPNMWTLWNRTNEAMAWRGKPESIGFANRNARLLGQLRDTLELIRS